MSEPKKKRGRKPKNKIVTNENPVFESNCLDDILITCIKKPKKDILIKEEIEPHDTEKTPFEDYNHTCINKCWNCSYNIEGEIYSFPLSYFNGVFNINGNFCSNECSARYLYDKYNHKEFWDKYYLLNFYVNLKCNTDTKVTIPLSKLRLVDYGGDLTKEEYLGSKNITYDYYTPPTLYVNNIYYNTDKINNNQGEFKLFRKKKKKNSFLENLT